jgi:hypothetical protein
MTEELLRHDAGLTKCRALALADGCEIAIAGTRKAKDCECQPASHISHVSALRHCK